MPIQSLSFDFLPRHYVIRRCIVLRKPSIELGFDLVAQVWLVTVVD
jgi:hypothetical protein